MYIVGRRREKLDAAVEHHSPSGSGEIIAIQGDISSKDGIAKVVAEIESKEKVLHILVNNAGINAGSTPLADSKSAAEIKDKLWKETGEKSPEPSSFQAWTDTYSTNVAAYYFVTVAFLPLLEAASNSEKGFSGTVILITSMSGITKQSQGGMFSYNSSKGAAIHLNEMLATELANNKIKVRVNSIGKLIYRVIMTRCSQLQLRDSSRPKCLRKILMRLASHIRSQRSNMRTSVQLGDLETTETWPMLFSSAQQINT